VLRRVVGKCVEYLNTFKTADIFSSYHKRGYVTQENKGENLISGSDREIKNQYDHMNLSDFEISQLLNLRPKNLDEARVLITRYVHAGKEAVQPDSHYAQQFREIRQAIRAGGAERHHRHCASTIGSLSVQTVVKRTTPAFGLSVLIEAWKHLYSHDYSRCTSISKPNPPNSAYFS
jgi:hypothetical protein